MKTKYTFRPLLAASILMSFSQANAASTFTLGSQFILESDNAGPGSGNGTSSYQISVNSNYAGYSGVAGTSSVDYNAVNGTFDGTLTAYRFWSQSANTIFTHTQSGGLISDISTTDATLSTWNAAKIWVTTDPNEPAWDSTPDFTGNIASLDEGATGTVNITGLSAGSLYIIYGAFRSTPSLFANMTGSASLGEEGDINIAELHGNGDFANNNEYYIARIDFVNEDGYTTLDWGMDAGFNGRLAGLVLTTIPEPSAVFLLGFSAISLLLRRC